MAVKDYNENSGMLAALVGGGIVFPPHRHGLGGTVRFPVCRLVPEGD